MWYLYITSCIIFGQVKATGTAAGRILKRHLVKALDDKMWEDIVALHVAATWLDPTLKSFSFNSHNKERNGVLKQAEEVIEGHAVVAACDLYQEAADGREVPEEDQEDDVIEIEEEQCAKRYKHDPLLEYRNSIMGEQPGEKLKKSARDLKTEVLDAIRVWVVSQSVYIRKMLLGSF